MIIKEQRGKKCPVWIFPYPRSVGNLSCEGCDHFKFKTTNHPNRDKNENPYYDSLGKPIMGTDEWCELLLDEEAEG